MDKAHRDGIATLKELLFQRKSAASFEELVGKQIEHHFPVDLWALPDSELDQEMAQGLSALNEEINCNPVQNTTSDGRFFAAAIALLHRQALKILRPSITAMFARQNRFNQDLVAFHLASFIRFRRLEERARKLEARANEVRQSPPDNEDPPLPPR
jgi:hypothetical protein